MSALRIFLCGTVWMHALLPSHLAHARAEPRLSDGGASPEAARDDGTSSETVVVQRDSFGVPHLFAPTDCALFAAYGYVVAQDRLWQLELNRRAGRGQLAEILGARFVGVDRLVRGVGYTQAELSQQFATLSPEVQGHVRAYVAGINRYIAEVGDNEALLPYEFWRLSLQPEPWQVEDTVAFAAFMLRRFGEVGGREVDNFALLTDLEDRLGEHGAARLFDQLLWRNDPQAPVTIPQEQGLGVARGPMRHGSRPFASKLPTVQRRSLAALRESEALWLNADEAAARWAEAGVVSKLGSYAWVVAPSHSKEGVALLLGGPQMGASAPEVVHEVGLHSAQGLHVTGMAFAGVPYVLIGYNRDVAWTSTTAVGDNVDVYYEDLCNDGRGTWFNDACVPLHRWVETIDVRDDAAVTQEVVRAVHGPGLMVPGLGLVLTQKRPHWHREVRSLEAFWRFNMANTLQGFADAVPFVTTEHNFLYADRAGNIAYWQAGEVPRRSPDYDARLPVPGDGSAEWTGELLPTPTSINPSQGFLANWNNKPSPNFDDADNRRFGKQHRLSDIVDRLQAGPVGYQDLFDIAADIARVDKLGRETRFLRGHLLAALQAVPPRHPLAATAQRVLRDWSGEVFADAVASERLEPAYVLFKAWRDALLQDLYGDLLGERRGYANADTLVHDLDAALGGGASIPVQYDIFAGRAPQQTISTAFDAALGELAGRLGDQVDSWWEPRPQVGLDHPLVGRIATVPLSNRATFAQVLRCEAGGIEGANIFTLGQSGYIARTPDGTPQLDEHFADLLPLYRRFDYKPTRLRPPPG